MLLCPLLKFLPAIVDFTGIEFWLLLRLENWIKEGDVETVTGVG